MKMHLWKILCFVFVLENNTFSNGVCQVAIGSSHQDMGKLNFVLLWCHTYNHRTAVIIQ